MQKNFRYLESEVRITCETEDWESIERKDTKLSETISIPIRLGPYFRYPGFIEEFLNSDWENVANEEDSETVNNDEVFSELDDHEEDLKKNWLPSPCFIHRTSMNYPTPKQTFSPNKPFRFPNS